MRQRSILQRKRWAPSVLMRVTAALVIVALVPLIVASLQLIRINQRSMQDQVLQTQVLAARSTAGAFANWIDARNVLVRSLAAADGVTEDPQELGSLMQKSLATWADLGVEALARLDPQSVLDFGVRLRGGSFDLEALSGLPGQPGIALFEADGRSYVALSEGSRNGRMVLVTATSPLLALLRPTELRGDAEASLSVIDAAAHAVLGDLLTPLPEALHDAAISGRVDGSGMFGGPQEDPMLAAYSPIEGTPWTVISMQPRRIAERVAVRMRSRAILAIAAATALLAGLLLAAYAALVRPLRTLARAQTSLAGAHSSGDFIKDLGASFQALEQRVRDSEDLGEVFLGRYQVLKMIGRGGMGTVFRGWDPSLERQVALKTVRFGDSSGLSNTRKQAVSLVREAVTAARLNHPNVVTIFDVANVGHAAYVAMELVEGISLETRIMRAPLDEGLIPPLGLAVARALATAHDHDVLHRDIKTANVLLGYDGAIKVTDFGLAELASAAQPSGDTVFGSPGYVAPELLKGDAPRPASDVFALGVVLYEAASGYPPFHAWSVEDTLARTITGTFVPLAELAPQLDDGVRLFTENCLSQDPEARPSARHAVEFFEQQVFSRKLAWRAPERRPTAAIQSSERHASRLVATERVKAPTRQAIGSPPTGSL